MIWTRLVFCMTFVGCAHPAEALSSLSPCKTGYVEWDKRTLTEIVEASDVIYVGRAEEFVKDDSRPGYDGYYIVGNLSAELKGKAYPRPKIYGAAPYPYPPQSYFLVKERHAKIPENATDWALYGGETGIWAERKNGLLVEGPHCPLLPRFVLGYDYLIMLGTESRMSFEPIHSYPWDNWYKLVRDTVWRLEK